MKTRSILGASLVLLGACATGSGHGVTEPIRHTPLSTAGVPDGVVRARAPASSRGDDARATLPIPPPARQDYSPQGLFGQAHGDFINSMEPFRPAVHASFATLPNASLDSEPGEYDLRRYRAGGRVPVVFDPDSVLLLGANFGLDEYDFSSNFGGVENDELIELSAEIGYGRFLTDDTYAYATFKPGVYSDFGGALTSQDWQFHGEAVAVFRYREDIFLKAGLRVSDDFEDVDLFPLLGFAWLLSPTWRVDLLAPVSAEISFMPTAATSLHAGLELEGNEYRVRSSSGAVGGKQEYDWHIQELRLYLGAVHRFDDHLSAFGRVGTVLAGDQNFVAPGNQPVDVEGQADPTLLLEVGIGWDF